MVFQRSLVQAVAPLRPRPRGVRVHLQRVAVRGPDDVEVEPLRLLLLIRRRRRRRLRLLRCRFRRKCRKGSFAGRSSAESEAHRFRITPGLCRTTRPSIVEAGERFTSCGTHRVRRIEHGSGYIRRYHERVVIHACFRRRRGCTRTLETTRTFVAERCQGGGADSLLLCRRSGPSEETASNLAPSLPAIPLFRAGLRPCRRIPRKGRQRRGRLCW